MNSAFVALLLLLAPQRIRMGDTPGVSTGVVAPQVATYTDPFYTRTARENKIEGTVTVEGAFDVYGNVTVLRTVKGLGYGLDESALAALKSWKFCPALRNGAPVEAIGQIDILFNLADAPPIQFDDMSHVEPGTSSPTVSKRVEPQYTDEARARHIQGAVVLQAVIETDGTTKIIKVVQPLDLGLTESAIRALQQWTFHPAVRNGKPIPVSVNIEVNFNLEKSQGPTRASCLAPVSGR